MLGDSVGVWYHDTSFYDVDVDSLYYLTSKDIYCCNTNMCCEMLTYMYNFSLVL